MSELLAELRHEASNWSATCGGLFDKAADEIERLRAVLHRISRLSGEVHTGVSVVGTAMDIASAALGHQQNMPPAPKYQGDPEAHQDAINNLKRGRSDV